MNTSNKDTSSLVNSVALFLDATLNGRKPDPEVGTLLRYWSTEYSKSLTGTSDPSASLAAELTSTREALTNLTQAHVWLLERCKTEFEKRKDTSKRVRKLERAFGTPEHSSKHRETVSDDEDVWETASDGLRPTSKSSGPDDGFATMDSASTVDKSSKSKGSRADKTSKASEGKGSALSKSSKRRYGKGKGKRSGATGTESGDESE